MWALCRGPQVHHSVGPMRPICSGRIWLSPVRSQLISRKPGDELSSTRLQAYAQNHRVPTCRACRARRSHLCNPFGSRREKAPLPLFTSQHLLPSQRRARDLDATAESHVLSLLVGVGTPGLPPQVLLMPPKKLTPRAASEQTVTTVGRWDSRGQGAAAGQGWGRHWWHIDIRE